jgi:hypothetical protein
MNFGNSITDGNKVGTGKYGFIVSFDLSEGLMDHVTQIVIQKPSGELSRPSTKPVTIIELLSFPTYSKCPDMAYAQSGNIVFIFLKAKSYSYESGYRVAISWIRKPIPVKKLTDHVDIPPGTEVLMSALLLKEEYKVKNEPVPQWVLNKIRSEYKRLGIPIPKSPLDWMKKRSGRILWPGSMKQFALHINDLYQQKENGELKDFTSTIFQQFSFPAKWKWTKERCYMYVKSVRKY